MVSRPVVSTTAEERRQRIDAFKAKISALRASSKVYHFESDASINTIDSLTTCGSPYAAAAVPTTLAALPESPNSEKRDNSEEVRKNSPNEVAERATNPFLEDSKENDGDSFEPAPTQVHKPASTLLAMKKETGLDSPRDDNKDINAFREKVASLRAMRKEYNFKSDISLNTFDSVSTGVPSNNDMVQLRIRNMLDRSRRVLDADQPSNASDEIETNPFLVSEDDSSSKLPVVTNQAQSETTPEDSLTTPRPATNLLLQRAETLSNSSSRSNQRKSVKQEEQMAISSGNPTKQSATSSSTFSGSSMSGFSIGTIDEVEVVAESDQPSAERKSDQVKSHNPFATLLEMRQASEQQQSVVSVNVLSSSDDSLDAERRRDVDENGSFDEAVANEIQMSLNQVDSGPDYIKTEGLKIAEDAKEGEGILLRDWNGHLNNEVVVTPSVLPQPDEKIVGDDKSATDDSDTTQTCSNSNKVDYLAIKDRETTLIPPKQDVVISDESISTKHSIFGKVVNVTNHDLVAERIYYESLRAQYHAELKVHVADEEIRLALDARLKAIQDFYKKKSTVVQIQECYGEEYQEKVASLPKVKPTLIRDNNEVTDKPSLSQSNSFSSRQETHKFAFERAHHGIDEAIKAAHVEVDEFPIEDSVPLEESASEIPETIFTNESFWSEGVEQPPTTEELDLPDGSLYRNHSKTAVNAWYFYVDVNNLLFESRLYDYEFKCLQKDPLYPYLNSLVGIADSGDDACTNEDKRIKQQSRANYADQSPIRICHYLVEDAVAAMPKLKEICVDIGTKLSMKTFAVGPIKKASDALLKCIDKYGGDPLLVTDFCRVAMIVKDIATLLAVMEILLTKYKEQVRRIKLSNLRANHAPLVGGYRDCKVNIDVDGHICEIQIHLEPMWNIKEGKGYAHYKSCKANDVDSTTTYDIKRMLSGLNRKFLSELVMVGADAAQQVHLEDLHSGNEESIRRYFALACIYLKKGSPGSAEIVLSRLVRVRSDSLIFGPRHSETLIFMRKLHESLKRQHKFKAASLLEAKIENAMRSNDEDYEPTLAEMCVNDHCGAWEQVCDTLLDPSAVEKEKIEKHNEIVEESRALWLSLRKTYWSLDDAEAVR